MEIFVDDETKLTLHGLQQYYVKLKDNEKNRKLFDLLDVLEFNQNGGRARAASPLSAVELSPVGQKDGAVGQEEGSMGQGGSVGQDSAPPPTKTPAQLKKEAKKREKLEKFQQKQEKNRELQAQARGRRKERRDPQGVTYDVETPPGQKKGERGPGGYLGPLGGL
ncbi:hypothetical protein AV530_008847 [Patagioenas fasciata monilis]|uniref:Uncharacterized protein n=1 Tax=Patagioenas fasciata monilis TaxID=372326 RepID=A0A1V4K4T6_PATFA|nr:hypothetical protein AV530_008847 [Patagioenas fasciata monilis]